jgi:hypothetical protein
MVAWRLNGRSLNVKRTLSGIVVHVPGTYAPRQWSQLYGCELALEKTARSPEDIICTEAMGRAYRSIVLFEPFFGGVLLSYIFLEHGGL